MDGQDKFHLVGWAGKIPFSRLGRGVFSYSVQGLGVHKIITFNQALLGKWLWRFRVEQEHFWHTIIKKKYGEFQGDWSTTVVRRPYGSNLWRGIQASWDRFSAFVLFRVGNGKNIRFWHEVQCRDKTLKELYPELYLIAVEKDASVQFYINF